jgi:hypothetical protein
MPDTHLAEGKRCGLRPLTAEDAEEIAVRCRPPSGDMELRGPGAAGTSSLSGPLAPLMRNAGCIPFLRSAPGRAALARNSGRFDPAGGILL